jgi:hypothetical protein
VSSLNVPISEINLEEEISKYAKDETTALFNKNKRIDTRSFLKCVLRVIDESSSLLTHTDLSRCLKALQTELTIRVSDPTIKNDIIHNDSKDDTGLVHGTVVELLAKVLSTTFVLEEGDAIRIFDTKDAKKALWMKREIDGQYVLIKKSDSEDQVTKDQLIGQARESVAHQMGLDQRTVWGNASRKELCDMLQKLGLSAPSKANKASLLLMLKSKITCQQPENGAA